MTRLFRNNLKKWVVESDDKKFEFDTISEAKEKVADINKSKLREMSGICFDCHKPVIQCVCKQIEDYD